MEKLKSYTHHSFVHSYGSKPSGRPEGHRELINKATHLADCDFIVRIKGVYQLQLHPYSHYHVCIIFLLFRPFLLLYYCALSKFIKQIYECEYESTFWTARGGQSSQVWGQRNPIILLWSHLQARDPHLWCSSDDRLALRFHFSTRPSCCHGRDSTPTKFQGKKRCFSKVKHIIIFRICLRHALRHTSPKTPDNTDFMLPVVLTAKHRLFLPVVCQPNSCVYYHQQAKSLQISSAQDTTAVCPTKLYSKHIKLRNKVNFQPITIK